MSTEEADVLVVGGGPVGLTMAAELSYHNVNTILIEKSLTTSNSPRAFSLSSRTMEHFRRLGVEEKIQDAAYPRDLLVTVTISTGAYRGNVMYKKIFSSWGEIADNVKDKEFPLFQLGASASPPMLCPQFTTEAVMRKHIEDTSKCVRMFWGWQVTAIAEDEDGVTLKAVNGDGEEKTFRSQYVVGCDGGSSFVRKELALHTYGLFVVSRACTITFHSLQLMEHMKVSQTTGFLLIINKDITCLMILLNGKGDYAMHIFLPSSSSDEEVEWHVQNAKECVESAIGSSDLSFDVQAASGYNMHALISTKFREGRCFLAGDSAHQWLPAGGLGLNTGISDVADLSWKIAAMVNGYGGKYLLDSYHIERNPLDDSTRRFALSIGQNILASRVIVKLRQFLITNPIVRNLFGRLNGGSIVRQFGDGMDIILGFQYSNSNIVMHQYNEDGCVRFHCNEAGEFTPSSLPGCRAPHVVLPEYPSILDLFGKHFVVLIVGGVDADLKDLKEILTKERVPFSSYTYPPLPELVELYNRKYFLIRPDGVVAWRSDFQPSTAESTKIVATVLGHTIPPRLPPPIIKYSKPTAPVGQSFLRDVIIRVSITGLLANYTELPLMTAGMVGFGIFVLLRALSVSPPQQNIQFTSRHKAATINQYGNANMLQIEPRHVGKFGPDDVLIQVHASSVTEQDLLIIGGHGSQTYQQLAKIAVGGPYFPLILGRDCSGEVVAIGDNVSEYLPGDQVYAVIPPYRQGAHAQMVAVDEKHVAFKPSNVDHKEAASLPWVAMTAWTALVKHAGINQYNAHGKKILVHRGTGGVGSFAVQMLKAWGASVTTTCTVENTTLAHHLGADKVVDDNTGDFSGVLGGYDVVLDTVGGKFERPSLSTLKLYHGSVYVNIVSPREKLINSLGGFLGGLVFSSLYRCKVFIHRIFGGRAFYYSSTEIEKEYLEQVRGLVESGAVRPLIDAVYSLDEVIDAHRHVETELTRGKVVIAVR